MSNHSCTLVSIQPYLYLSPHVREGHKKDTENINRFMSSCGIDVKCFYCRGITLFDYKGGVADFNILDLVRDNHLPMSKIMISPLHRLRKQTFLLKKRKPIIYIADSILKTSIYGFIQNPRYLHRVIYGYIVERFIRGLPLILASLEEYTWFTSSGHNPENLFLIQPIPMQPMSIPMCKENNNKIRLLFYNPSGHGVNLAIKIIQSLCNNSKSFIYEIIVTGVNSKHIISSVSLCNSIQDCEYVENIDALIMQCDFVFITDIGGSGTCNRAMQVRYHGVPLICTYDGIRGTNMYLDDGVYLFRSIEEAIVVTSKVVSKGRRIASESMKQVLIRYNQEMNKLVEQCLAS